MFHPTPPKSRLEKTARHAARFPMRAGALAFALLLGLGLTAATGSALANTPEEVASEEAALSEAELDARLARLFERASADLGARVDAACDRIAREASGSQLTAMIELGTRRGRGAVPASRR